MTSAARRLRGSPIQWGAQSRPQRDCARTQAGRAVNMVRLRRQRGRAARDSRRVHDARLHHCFCHSRYAQMLRLGGKVPPQRSDLIFWAADRHSLLDRDPLAEQT